jgi:hypothetical protein
MGWLFTYDASKADIIHDLTTPEENASRRWETIAHCVRGNVLWAVIEITRKQENRRKRFIACYLLARQTGYGWGYKDMEESMHPCYYSCPLKYLDMVPVANADWRTAVRTYHRNRTRKLTIGQKIGIKGSTLPWVVITSLRPLTGEHGGRRYRVPRRLLGDAL